MLAEMNVMNLKGELTPEQERFFAPSKPEVELFDLRNDPHEVTNLADDPKYADTKTRLLAELQRWRTDVIDDQGVSEEFRAVGVFPDACPVSKVDKWVEENASNYDFNKTGWPAWYPTRTLAEWEKALALWKPYVFRGPSEEVSRPSNVHAKKKQKN